MSTLNENILKVKETLNEIADAIKEQGVNIDECSSPESYGEKIKSIGENIELDADKIHTKAYDIGDLDPRVEVSNTEDGKILFTFGLKRGPQGLVGPAGPSGAPGPAGLNGVPGKDGSQIEYIYKQVPTEETVVEKPNNSQEDNYIPKLEGWTGEPQGVTNVFQVERCCIRKKIDGVWGDWSKPSIYARWGKDGEQGRSIVSVEKLFAVNNDPNNYPTEGWTTIENVSTSSTNRYMWCEEITTFTSGEPSVIHYIIAIEGEPGANGTGVDAPIIYPAGVWDDEKEYIAESDKVPYVFYTVDEKYYMLNSKYLVVGEGEGSTWKGVAYAPGKTYEDESIWLPIDSFEVIYSDIGLFNQALVGKWVFHGDYMFSQEGVDVSGNLKKYSDFTDPKRAISNGTFKPNVLFNSVTGAGNLKDVVVEKVNTHTIENGIDKSVTIENGEIASHNGDAVFGKVVIGNNNYGNQVNIPLYKGNNTGSWETLNAGGQVVLGSINAQNASGIHTITIQPGYVKFKTEIISPGVTLCLKNNSTTIYEQQLTIQGTDSSGYYSAIADGVVWDFDCTDVDKLDVVIVFKGQSGKTFTEISWNIISYIYQETQSTNTYLGKDGLTISGPDCIIKISESNTTMMYGSYGFRVSSEGIQKTSDAGATWTSI